MSNDDIQGRHEMKGFDEAGNFKLAAFYQNLSTVSRGVSKISTFCKKKSSRSALVASPPQFG
jgi:hypothetical protein